uniref:alginate O-acetyltransferase AlgX-related protein n=1 Tax=Saccharothrix mutabilis TaxID=33921 RepID=UPI0031D00500
MSTDRAESPTQQARALPALPESFLPVEHALYRPRHSARQRTARYAAVLYFFLPLAMLAVGLRPAEFENRKLAEFPSITDGWGFFTGLEKWASDHLPLRDRAVAAADGISRGLFGEAPQFERPQGPVGPVQTTPPKDPSLDRPDPTAFVQVIEGKDDWLYLGTDIRVACEPTVPTEEMYARLGRLKQAVEASGRRFILAIAPNKSTMVPEYLPSRYFGKDCAPVGRDAFWNTVVSKTGALDLRPALKKAAEEKGGPVYPKYDSHWTHDGSVVMAKAVAEAIDPGVTRTWEVSQVETHERDGDLAALIGRKASDRVPEYRLEPDGEQTRSLENGVTDRDPRHFTQDQITGVTKAKVAFVGDSFGYYSVPYVAAAFTDLRLQHADGAVKDPAAMGRMLAESDIIVIEAAERNLVGGMYPLLRPEAIDAIAAELAARPRR